MSRGLVPVVVVAATFCGYVHLAYADTCPTPVPFTINECSVTGTMANGTAEVSFPQIDFNPAQGTPFGFNFLLSATLNGTANFSFTCDEPFGCDYGGSFNPVVSDSPGSPISFTFQTPITGTMLTCFSGQTCNSGFPWTDAVSDATMAQDYDPTQPDYNPDLQQLVTGTGELNFGLTESLANLSSNSFTGNTFGPSPYTVTLEYGFIPPTPVPEPALAPVAAALFGLIVWRWRQRRATILTP
jgi:hypothetical protein